MPEIAWQITVGDLLTLAVIVAAAVVFVLRLGTRVSVQQAEIVSLQRQVDALTLGGRQGVEDRDDADRSMDDRLDRKQDKK